MRDATYLYQQYFCMKRTMILVLSENLCHNPIFSQAVDYLPVRFGLSHPVQRDALKLGQIEQRAPLLSTGPKPVLPPPIRDPGPRHPVGCGFLLYYLAIPASSSCVLLSSLSDPSACRDILIKEQYLFEEKLRRFSF